VACIECGANTENFYEHDGQPYCEDDYLRLFCSCNECGEVIESEAPFIALHGTAANGGGQLDYQYHTGCFRCHGCKASLEAADRQDVHFKNGKVYCKNDYQRMFAVKCRACDEFIGAAHSPEV
jgi:hypothetical protein